MTDTDADADTGITPEPLFSAEDGIDVLWVRAYQGEVLGEALFDGIAELLADPEHARKMRRLGTLERRTKEATAPALQRAGISTDPDPETLATAAALTPGAAGMAWDELMATVGPITAQYIPLYERIGELDRAEQATAALLVAHEKALRDFARSELAGDAATSLDAVNALAHMR